MDQTKLRIGNLVQDKDGQEQTIQNGWELDEGDELFPVIITEDHLKRMSFCYTNITHHDSSISSGYKIRHFWIVKMDRSNKWIVGLIDMGNKINFVTNIEFVHQLQNIFFDVMDIELPL